MTGKVFLCKSQSELLGTFTGQSTFIPVFWVEADDIVMGLHILPPAVLAVLAVGNQASHSERGFTALKSVEQV